MEEWIPTGGSRLHAMTHERHTLPGWTADIRLGLQIGPDLANPRHLDVLVVVLCDHPIPDPGIPDRMRDRTVEAVKHILHCPDAQRTVERLRADRARRDPRYADAPLWALVRYLDRIPPLAQWPALTSEGAVDEYVEENPIASFVGQHDEVFTLLGRNADALPATLATARPLAAVFIRPPRGVVGREILPIQPSRAPKAAITTWLTSVEPATVAARLLIEEAAVREGARIVWAHVGRPVPVPPTSVRDEIAELREKIARLEIRGSAAA